VEELARACGTIAYEILVGIGPRISRVAVRRSV
jgi:alanine racemase